MRQTDARYVSARLSEATTGKVSHNALSRYEKGIMLPGSEILLAVSKALDQKPDYFFRPF
jgi:transcriptional regulator with XRE-family HTH domain